MICLNKKGKTEKVMIVIKQSIDNVNMKAFQKGRYQYLII